MRFFKHFHCSWFFFLFFRLSCCWRRCRTQVCPYNAACSTHNVSVDCCNAHRASVFFLFFISTVGNDICEKRRGRDGGDGAEDAAHGRGRGRAAELAEPETRGGREETREKCCEVREEAVRVGRRDVDALACTERAHGSINEIECRRTCGGCLKEETVCRGSRGSVASAPDC